MGVVTVTVESCKGIHAKKDPYCIVVCGGKQHKTPVAKGDVWNSKAEFEGGDSVEVRVYDDDVLFDDFMGAAKFSLKEGKQEAPIKAKDGKEIGTLIISVSLPGGHGSSGHGDSGSGHGDSGHGEGKKKKKERRGSGSGSGSSSSDSD